jgi:capsular polysaccharide biosynthesis protein
MNADQLKLLIKTSLTDQTRIWSITVTSSKPSEEARVLTALTEFVAALWSDERLEVSVCRSRVPESVR